MGLVDEDELIKAFHGLFDMISTLEEDFITWPEFMSYLLHCHLDADPQQQEPHHTVVTKQSTKKAGERKKKSKTKGKRLQQEHTMYDARGHLVSTHDRKLTERTKETKLNTNINITTKPKGKMKSKEGKHVSSTAKENWCSPSYQNKVSEKKNATTPAIPDGAAETSAQEEKTTPAPRTYVIGSKMNSGKLGGRHLQLHVFPN